MDEYLAMLLEDGAHLVVVFDGDEVLVYISGRLWPVEVKP